VILHLLMSFRAAKLGGCARCNQGGQPPWTPRSCTSLLFYPSFKTARTKARSFITRLSSSVLYINHAALLNVSRLSACVALRAGRRPSTVRSRLLACLPASTVGLDRDRGEAKRKGVSDRGREGSREGGISVHAVLHLYRIDVSAR
jgi:hypothetical protein